MRILFRQWPTRPPLFDDENIVPPVDVTAAANNDGATAAAPDALLRTNGIASPEDAAQVGEGQAGGQQGILIVLNQVGPSGVRIDNHHFSRNLFCGEPKVVSTVSFSLL